MSNISRLVPIRRLDVIDPKTLNKELNNIIYTWNAHNSGQASWSNVSVQHIAGATAAPGISVNTTGLGTNGTASIVGSDVAGTITLNTSSADTPGANSDIVTVTFNIAFSSAPYVTVSPASDTAYNLALGVVRCRTSDTTATIFKLRSGATPLPATTTATYLFNYNVFQ